MRKLAKFIVSSIAFGVIFLLLSMLYARKFEGLVSSIQEVKGEILFVVLVFSVVTVFSACLLALALEPKGDKPIHPDKLFIYNRFMEVWFRTSSEHDERLDKAMALWANDGVLREYIKLKEISQQSPIREVLIRLQVERVTREMRKDLGQKNHRVRMGKINKMLSKSNLENFNNQKYEEETEPA